MKAVIASFAGRVALVSLVAWPATTFAESDAKEGAATASIEKAATTTAAVASDVADWGAKTAEFDKMRTPDSPAFVLLGVSPTEIQRPGTPMAVATSLSGFVSGTGLAIPTNLALEVAPFWLSGHPELTAKDYESGGWRNVYRTLTFSVGTKQTSRKAMDAAGVTTDHSDSDLALGVRTRLYGSGTDKGKSCADKLSSLREKASTLGADVTLPEQTLKELRQAHPDDDQFTKEVQKAQTALKAKATEQAAALEAARKELDKKCFDVTAAAHGLSLDLAGAVDWTFVDSVASLTNGDLVAGAGWLTGAYANDWGTAALMARYAARQVGTEWEKMFDAGLRLVYKHDAFAISGEGVGRALLAGPGSKTFKVDLVAEYNVTGESWVTVTFGRTFETAQASAIFSVANFTWAFGKPKI